MSTRSRISSLFRELAEAFDRLEDEERVKKTRKRLTVVPSEAAQRDVVEQVRNTVRKQGFRS